MHRRALIAIAALLPFAGCTGGQIDPQKVADTIKTTCQILVAAAQVAEILKLDPTLSASAIVNLICTGWMSAQAQQAGKLTAGASADFPVVVNGHTVIIHATRV